MGDWILRDGKWLHDPQAATPITPSDYDPNATRVGIPAVTPAGRVDFQGAVDWAWPPDGEDAEAPAEDYVYTDPVTDDAWPRITEASDDPPDAFPDGWGAEPTERDQAAIDAGNA